MDKKKLSSIKYLVYLIKITYFQGLSAQFMKATSSKVGDL